MSKKRYDKTSGEKQNRDIIGVGLIIISSLALVCLIFFGLFGVVSREINLFLRGTFGLFSYALFSSLLVWGVFLIRGKKIGLKAKQSALLFFAFFSLLEIIHLATSYNMIGDNLGGYLSAVYKSGLTAGGVLGGLFVYPICLITNIVFAYIFYSVLLVAAILAVTDFRAITYFTKRKKREDNGADVRPFISSNSENFYDSGAGYRQSGNSLYIADIAEQIEKPKSRGSKSAPTEPLEMVKPQSMYAKAEGFSSQTEGLGKQNRKLGTEGQRPSGTKAEYTGTFVAKPPAKSSLAGDYQQSETYKQAKSQLFKNAYVSYSSSESEQRIPEDPQEKQYEKYETQVNIKGNYEKTEGLFSQAEGADKQKQRINEEGQRSYEYNEFKQEYSPQYINEEVKSSSASFLKDKPPMYIHGQKRQEQSFEEKTGGQRDYRVESQKLRDEVKNDRKKPEVSNDNFAVNYNPPARNESAFERKYDKPQEKPLNMYESTVFPYNKIPETRFVKDENPNPIINGDKYKKENQAEDLFGQSLGLKKEEKNPQEYRKADSFAKEIPFRDRRESFDEPNIEKAESGLFERGREIKRTEIEKEKNIVNPLREENVREDYERPPVDFTGMYKVLPPKREDNLFEEKVASFEENYPNLKPKRNAKTEINPIEEVISRNIGDAEHKELRHSAKKYVFPPIDLLEEVIPEETTAEEEEYTSEKAAKLEDALAQFKINAKVVGIVKGPAVTRYELQMPDGIPVKSVERYADDISYRLAVEGKINIETPIPGKTAVGIEIPNKKIQKVGLRDIIASKTFQTAKVPVTIALGKDIAGEPRVCNIEDCVHLLVAGTTGSGKSVCLNTLIISVLYKASPEDVRMILVDPKYSEFAPFEGIPHLLTNKIITSTRHAANAFDWAFKEMERRQKYLTKKGFKKLSEYNASQRVKDGVDPKMPYLLFIVDELSQLMMDNKKLFDDKVRAIAQKARSAGICLILATQRPSVDVITGTLKANLPSRIAFAVQSFPDSNTILAQGGAENLLGKGDMLYSPLESHSPVRIQGNYISTEEINNIIDFVKQNNEAVFDNEAEEEIFKEEEDAGPSSNGNQSSDGDEYDARMIDAARIGIELKQISISLVQRKLSIGYARAARIVDQLEKYKFISAFDGSQKPRVVYMTPEDFKDFFGEDY